MNVSFYRFSLIEPFFSLKQVPYTLSEHPVSFPPHFDSESLLSFRRTRERQKQKVQTRVERTSDRRRCNIFRVGGFEDTESVGLSPRGTTGGVLLSVFTFLTVVKKVYGCGFWLVVPGVPDPRSLSVGTFGPG